MTDKQSTLRIPVMNGGTFRTAVILLGGFFSVAFIALTVWTSLSAERDAITRLAQSYSGSVMSFRAYYAETVVGRVGGLVEITHDYHDSPRALPIPAIMTLELVDYMNLRDQSLAIAQISDYPFPWRAARVLTKEQRTALDALLKSGKDTYGSTGNP